MLFTIFQIAALAAGSWILYIAIREMIRPTPSHPVYRPGEWEIH